MGVVLERQASSRARPHGSWTVSQRRRNGMFLEPSELVELTGYKFPAYQTRWLKRHGYPVELSAGSKPRVLRSYVEKRFGGDDKPPSRETVKSLTEPDFSKWGK